MDGDQVLGINRQSSHVKMYRNSILIQNHLTLHYCLKMVEIKDLAYSFFFPNYLSQPKQKALIFPQNLST